MKRNQILLTILIICFLAITKNVFAENELFVDSLNDISYDLGNSFPDSAFKVGEKSYHIAQNIGYTNGEITALCRMGRIVYKKGLLDSSLYYFTKAENLFSEKGKDSIYLAKTLVYYGLVNRKLGKLDLAIENYETSYSIATLLKDELLMGECLINISNLFKSKGEYKNALEFLHQALEKFSNHNYDQLGLVYLNIGNIQDIQNRFDKSLKSYNQAYSNFKQSNNIYSIAKCLINIGGIHLSLNNIDSSFHYYDLAYSISIDNGFKSLEAKVDHNKGELFLINNNLDSSLFYFQKSLATKLKNNNLNGQAINYERIGDINILKNNVEEGLSNFILGYTISRALQEHSELLRITNKISSAYAQMQNMEQAVFYQKLANRYQDSISQNLSKVLIYEINYNNEKYKVAQLQADLENHALSKKKQNIILWSIFGIGITIIFFLIITFRQKQKNNASVKRIDDLLKNQEKITINAMLDGQENERNRIADELHDRLGSMLSMVKLYFKSMDKQINNLKAENIVQFEKANLLLDEACEETRKIAHKLSSGLLSKIGLFSVVKDLVNKIEDSGEINVELITHGTDDNLGTINEIAIYRIIQELISNTLKHAEASEITIQLNVFEEIFNVIFEDNGKGFNINQMVSNSGMGLRGIEARIKNMDGEFSIDTAKHKGTSISIDIPINQKI